MVSIRHCRLRSAAASVAVLLVSMPLSRACAAAESYDLVISGGRVMDPESGLDGARNVGISGGKIRAISSEPLTGKQTLEARGLVVAPGFIDLHEHGQEERNYQFQARDGVTTSLELELGTADVDKWYAERQGRSLINFGVSVGHIPARIRVTTGAQVTSLSALANPAAAAANHRELSVEELGRLTTAIEAALRRGALAEGMGINYTPGASHWEIIEMFRVAARYGAAVHVHLRYASLREPQTGFSALEEVIAAGAVTGAATHVVHVTSMGLKYTPQLIEMIAGAQRRGLDVTTECYPYTASSTDLSSAVFDEGWQEASGITYKDLQWAETGERLTPESFARYRKQGGIVVIHEIPAAAARAAVSSPIVMIASDGMPITGARIHPRGQGTFSRVLGHYVREERALDLMTALRKMTLMPAQRLEKRAPAFKGKGRIRVGADADITVFDANRVIDKATYEAPLQYSEGIQFVLVNGIPVVRNGQLVEGIYPGSPARAPLAQ
ncbi:MAG TPA: amidohydrolase family protein [Steroidobacteraceae bacterium]|nr:amidohydrolase family protein [Steroidobacteraceae bacterium]